jgi:predicted permease
MSFLAYIRSVRAKLFGRSQVAEEMEEELQSHIEHRVSDLERSGLTRAEAEHEARIEFGARERIKEECHEALGGRLFDSVLRDVRYCLRVLRSSKGFTIAAVITLAMAIGANAVVFSLLNALILRPLNVPDAQSLYGIERGKDHAPPQSYPDYLDLRDRSRSFDGLAAYSVAPAGLDTGENPTRVWLEEVSGNYFDVLRIHPSRGRTFHGTDEHGPNSAPYIVLSFGYWHSRFQGDPGVVGRQVRLNKHPFTILGVAPPEFHGTLMLFNPDFFVPIVDQELVEGESHLNARGNRWVFEVMGHLKPGVTPAQATADLNAIGADLEKSYPKDDGQMTFTLAHTGLFGDSMRNATRAFLSGLMLLAGLILLAACANLGSLFAARAGDRSREIALRLALGSSRGCILRQLFTEAILISLAGGAAGLLGGMVLLRALSAWNPLPRFPIHVPVDPDAKVYLVAVLLSLVSGFLFGAVPMRQILRTNPYEVVKLGSTGRIGRRIAVRDVLLVVQIAICAVLVTASLVAVRGLLRSVRTNFGFEPQNALLADTDLNMGGYRGDSAVAMQRRMIDAIKTIPGVTHVGSINWPPLGAGIAAGSSVFKDGTTDLKPSNAAASAVMYNISPDYFQAAGTSLLSGRAFRWDDGKNSPPVAVVNREFARRIFGSTTNAVGGYFKLPDGTRVQVVGVAENGKYASLTEDTQLAMFLPVTQSPVNSTYLVVRSERDPQQLTIALRNKLRDLDPALPFTIRPWEEELDGALFAPRMASISLGVLGIMGVMLSITGLFGMAAYSVSKRLRELGIRVALGAKRARVLRTALGRTVELLAIGSGAGLVFGFLASRVLAFIVYQATPRDPVVLAGVVLAMLLLGLVATWIPAQRALSVDPVKLLREE